MSVEVVNIAGRTVRRVCEDRPGTAGTNVVLWDGRCDAGTRAPAGRYLVRVTARGEDGQQSQALAALNLRR